MSGGRPSANTDLFIPLSTQISLTQGSSSFSSPDLEALPVYLLYSRGDARRPRHMLGDTYKFNNEFYTIVEGAFLPSVGQYVYKFLTPDNFKSAQTESAILAGNIGDPMPINTIYLNRLQTLPTATLIDIYSNMQTMRDLVRDNPDQQMILNAEMPCRGVTPFQSDWGPIGVDPRWNTSTQSEIVAELKHNSPDHMRPENIMFKTFIESRETMPKFLLGDVFQVGGLEVNGRRTRTSLILVISGVKIGETWYYELSYSEGGRGIYITRQLETFTYVGGPGRNTDLSTFEGRINKDLIREQYDHPLHGIRVLRMRRENGQRLGRGGSPAASPIRIPPRSSAAAAPPAPRANPRANPVSSQAAPAPRANPVSSQAAAEAQRKPELLLGDLLIERNSHVYLVVNGRWRSSPNGLTPSEYVYDLINKHGNHLMGWSKRKINRFLRPVPGSKSAAAVAHPLVGFPLDDSKRQEIEASRRHQQERMSGWIERPRARRRLRYIENTAPGRADVFTEHQKVLDGANTSQTPMINKLAKNLKKGRSHPSNPPPPDLVPGSGVKYDPKYLFGQFFRKGPVIFVVLGGEWINGEWVYVLLGSDDSMHRHTESQIAQFEKEMPDGSIQIIPPEARLVGVSLGRDQNEAEFNALIGKFSFRISYRDAMWDERLLYEYQMDELFLRGGQAREHTSPDETADAVLEERMQDFYRREQTRRSTVAKAHGDDFYVKKRLDDDLKRARKTRSTTRRQRRARRETIAAAKVRKEGFESREGSKQLATGQARINAKAKAWWQQNKEEHKCTICFDGFDDEDVNYTEPGKLFYAVQLRCGHWFHYNCIKMSQKPKTGPIDYQWAENNVRQRKFMDTLTCPVCRTPAVDDSFGDGVYRLINLRF